MQSHEDATKMAGVFTGVKLDAHKAGHPGGMPDSMLKHMQAGHPAGVPKGAGMPMGHPGAGGKAGQSQFSLQRNPEGADDENRFFAKEGVNPLTSAFEKKIAVHPGMGGMPVPAEESAALLQELLDQPRQGNSVIYIHVPFCETHCLYCGFYKNPYQKSQSSHYTELLVRELQIWRGKAAQESGPIHAVYLGGGTPTALEPEDIKRILLALKEFLPLANDCEITVEGRTSNLTKERIEAMLEGGANRFSLGVQSFNTKVRQSLGRRSTREELLEKIELLQSYNQASILLDLIYGLPGQDMEMWLDDIRTAQSLNLDGADLYQLNIFKTSLLAQAIEKGKMPSGAEIPEQARYFEAGVKAMQEAFYRRLSVSHWGRTPRERNLYNQYVKGTANCLFFGPGSGGNLHGYFGFNEPDYKKWAERVEKGEKPVAMLMRPTAHARLFKTLAEDMEQSRLPLGRIGRDFGINLEEMLGPLLSQWGRTGLLEKTGGGHVLTLAGQFWQVNLAQLLLEYLGSRLKESK